MDCKRLILDTILVTCIASIGKNTRAIRKVTMVKYDNISGDICLIDKILEKRDNNVVY